MSSLNSGGLNLTGHFYHKLKVHITINRLGSKYFIFPLI